MTSFVGYKNVVFTGPAFHPNGQPILREILKKAAQASGFRIQSSVQKTTDLLVASRADTVKALKAANRGIRVVTYPMFVAALGEVETGSTGGDPMVDTHDQIHTAESVEEGVDVF